MMAFAIIVNHPAKRMKIALIKEKNAAEKESRTKEKIVARNKNPTNFTT